MDTSDKEDEGLTDGSPMETLENICGRVTAFEIAYEDVAERIEDLVYYEYGHDGLEHAVRQLEKVAHTYEGMRNKSEEICRDLAQVYLLIGQVYQYAERYAESIEWLYRAAVVDDMHPVVYHSLAQSYRSIGDEDMAIKCLEQEIAVAPGNYYTYLLLADIYEACGRFGALEEVLKRLLERDPDNIQGMHRLIQYYQQTSPDLDVELLRRRLLERGGPYTRIEAVIRASHMCSAGHCGEAVTFLTAWSAGAPDVSITHLAIAHIYGLMRQFSRKRRELSLFKKKNRGREDAIEIKLTEFATVFGQDAAENIRRRLRVAH